VLDGLLDLAGNAQATALVRAAAQQQLGDVSARLARAPGATAEERAHRASARGDIERFFEGRDDRASRSRPAQIPLPWP